MPHKHMRGEAAEEPRCSALAKLWTNSDARNAMAKERLLFVAVSGEGVRIVDS